MYLFVSHLSIVSGILYLLLLLSFFIISILSFPLGNDFDVTGSNSEVEYLSMGCSTDAFTAVDRVLNAEGA
jgi:hypothetical protein